MKIKTSLFDSAESQTTALHSRRGFLKTAVLGGAAWTILKNSGSVYGYPENETVTLAIIGCGGRGRSFAQLEGCCALGNTKGVRIGFLCDIDEKRAAPAFNDFPEARKGRDYRVMFDKFHKEIDAVVVATGDYAHAPASAAAIRAGKHVYCEKPLTVTVREARMLARLASERKVVTQMGNQAGYDRKAVNAVWSGMIGEVREAFGWTDGGATGRRPLPAGHYPVPPTFNWDLWLGPSPWREYHPEWLRYLTWREFGNFFLGNFGSHTMATMFKSLKIGELWKTPASEPHPIIRVTGECDELCLYSFPKAAKATFRVPARAEMPPVTIYWHESDLSKTGRRRVIEEALGRKLNLGGPGEKWEDMMSTFMLGEKGTLFTGAYGTFREILPKEKFENCAPPNMLPPDIGSPGITGFLNAIRGGPKPMCSFDEFSGPYIEFLLLVSVSTLFPEEELEFDPIDCRIINNSLANYALSRPYRPGWDMEAAL